MGSSAYASPARAGEMIALKAREIRQITRKRQVTIPKEMCDALNIQGWVEFRLLDDETLLLKPVRPEGFDLSLSVLTDLVREGFEGEELVRAFQERKAALHGVIDRLSEEIDSELRRDPDAGPRFMNELLSDDDGDR